MKSIERVSTKTFTHKYVTPDGRYKAYYCEDEDPDTAPHIYICTAEQFAWFNLLPWLANNARPAEAAEFHGKIRDVAGEFGRKLTELFPVNGVGGGFEHELVESNGQLNETRIYGHAYSSIELSRPVDQTEFIRIVTFFLTIQAGIQRTIEAFYQRQDPYYHNLAQERASKLGMPAPDQTSAQIYHPEHNLAKIMRAHDNEACPSCKFVADETRPGRFDIVLVDQDDKTHQKNIGRIEATSPLGWLITFADGTEAGCNCSNYGHMVSMIGLWLIMNSLGSPDDSSVIALPSSRH